MADVEHGPSFPANFSHLYLALFPKGRIAHSQHFIKDQYFRFEVDCHREGQPQIHTRRVVFNRRLQKPFDLCEGYDLLKLAFDLITSHSNDRAIEINILSTREFGVKARANFQKAAYSTIDVYFAGRRFDNARKNLQQGRLAGAVSPDNAYDFAGQYFKADVFKYPKKVIMTPRVPVAATKGGLSSFDNCVTQYGIYARKAANSVLLAKLSDFKNGLH